MKKKVDELSSQMASLEQILKQMAEKKEKPNDSEGNSTNSSGKKDVDVEEIKGSQI